MARSRRRGRARRLLGWLGIAAAGTAVAMIARAERERARGGVPAPSGEPVDATPPPEDAGLFVDALAGRLFVRQRGESGPALLLVHGLGGSGAQWSAQLAALGQAFRVVAPDLRGHGRSDAPTDGEQAIAAYVDDLLAVADALGLERFAVAGHSMGALVASELAARAPQRVRALALVDPGGDGTDEPEEEIAAALEELAEDPHADFAVHYREFLHGARPATTRRVLADLRATPEATLLGGYAAAMRYPARERLAAFRGPTLCIASALNDAPGSLPRSVPELPTEWLAPASHWLMMDRPEEVSGLLAELLASAPG